MFRGEPHLALKNVNSLPVAVVAFLRTLPAVVAVKRDKRSRDEKCTTAIEIRNQEATAKAEQHELQVCTRYKHRSLCCMLAACTDDGPHRCLVFEFCSGGSLFESLHPEEKLDSKSLTPAHLPTASQRFKYAAYSAQGLEYLHSAGQTKFNCTPVAKFGNFLTCS